MASGGKREGAGRKEGSVSVVTKDTREAFKHLVEDNTAKFQGWIDKIAETNPVKAMELVTNLAEYVLSKLSRSEFVGEIKVENVENIENYSDEDLKIISDLRKKNKQPFF